MNGLINKFPNGRKLYIESVQFKNIVDFMFYGGLSEYEAIEHLIEVMNNKEKQYLERMKSTLYPVMTVNCDDFAGCPFKEKKNE